MGSLFSHAWRSWKGAKAIALLSTLAFAVGIGSTTAIYTVVNAVMLRALPYADSDRFVALYSAQVDDPVHYGSNTIQDLREYEQRTTSFDVFGWFRPQALNLTAPGEPRHVQAASVTPSLAQNLGVSPIIGRWFTDDSSVVISSRLWRQLGSDPKIVGQGLTINGRRLTITGVMGRGFQLPLTGPGTEGFESDVWVYLDPLGKGLNPGEGYYFAYARRKPGVTLAQAEAEVKRIAVDIAKMAPASHPSYTARLVDLREMTFREIRPTLLLLFGAAGLLLLITCANVAGLLLARSVARARETATRVALGASQRQLALHYFIEGSFVSLAGAAAGVVVSIGLVRLVISIGSEFIPRAEEIAVDWTVIGFALAMAVLTSVLSSLAPLWQALRTAPNDVLTAGVRASASARVRKLSQLLVVAEIALAFTLLGVSAVLIGHLRNLARTSAGFDTDHLLTFSVTMPESIAAKDETRVPYQRRLTEALEAIPGVTGAGFANQLPLAGCCLGGTIYQEGSGSNVADRTAFIISDPGFLRTLKVPLRSGRFLTEADTSEDPLHVLINQAAAARYWPGRNPTDQSDRLNGPQGSRFRIVGVVGDVRNDGLGRPTVPEVYLSSMVAAANPLDFVVRSPLPADQLLSAVRRAVRTVDPTLPIHDAITMADIVHNSMVLERVGSLMTTFFALAALLMATLGVYGIVSYAVRQRTVELGTRMALGAVGRDLLAYVIGGGLRMAGYGVAVGAVAVGAAIWLLVRSFNVHDIGWIPFASSTAIVAGLAAVASSFPAWRATRLSPMVAIRDESESLWYSARASIRRAVKEISKAVSSSDAPPAISEADLLAEFVTATRRAESASDAVRIAIGTLRNRLGAESALLLERLSIGGYGCTSAAPAEASIAFTFPADGFLLKRLEAFAFPLPLSDRYFETLTRWAEEQRPERLAEIRVLKAIGARMAVGLQTKNEILGVLVLGPAVDREEYGEPERSALRSCAAQFALMIENGRLTSRIVEQEKLRRDLALAAEVQKRLLPEHPPEIGLAALSAVSLPARAVGGDYYDFIDVADKQIGIALADISGKGVAAALIMSAVQASLRILSSEPNLSLPQLAAKMNDFLHRSTPANKYATLFYAQIDEGRRQLRYVNAGHLPPYLLRRDGEPSAGQPGAPTRIVELSSGGAVIGLMPDMTYEEATIDLQAGDVLVAFTDGVTEAMNAQDEEFGEQRLKDLLREIVHLPVGDISSRISAALRDWIQNVEQYDDLTFIVLKVN